MRVVLRDDRSWPDETRRVPRGAVGELVLLEQHHVGLAHRRQVIGDAAPDDAPADDDDACSGGTGVTAHDFTRALVGS